MGYSLRLAPERFEPNPKLRVDDGVVLLRVEVPVPVVFAAVLGRVATEAHRVAGEPIGRVALTHPAGWGPQWRAELEDAAGRVGLGGVTLKPVAAAGTRAVSTVRISQHMVRARTSRHRWWSVTSVVAPSM